MRVAAQLYTLRDFLKTAEDAAVTLKKVKELGYNAVQVSGIGPIDNQTVKELCDQAGLTICATHNSYQDLWNNTDAVIEKHKLWNCQQVGIGSLPGDYRTDAAGFSRFAKEASEVGKRFKDAGMTFIYHNHAFEFIKYDGKTGLDILFEESDPAFVDFELDVHWVQAGGADPTAWIRKVAGRMKVVHLKDMVIGGPDKKAIFAEVGEGNMNFRAILDACYETGVEWGPVEQDNCYGRDPFECLGISARNLKALGASF